MIFFLALNSVHLVASEDWGMTAEKRFQLKVSESLTKDMGRGIARIDPLDMQAIGVKVGDVILISGQKQAAARIMPAYEERRGKRLIQIDGILRKTRELKCYRRSGETGGGPTFGPYGRAA